MKRHKGITVASFTLAVLLVVSLFVTVITAVMSITVMSPSFVLDNMEKTNFYQKFSQEIKSELYSVAASSGVDNALFDEVIQSNRVKMDTKVILEDIYSGKDSVSDNINTFKEEVKKSFKQYASNKGIQITSAVESAINTAVEKSANIYSNYLNPFSMLTKYFSTASQYTTIALIVSTVLDLVLALVIFLINRWKHIAVRYYVYTFSAVDLMLLISIIMSMASININNVSISVQSFYDLIVECFNSLSWTMVEALAIFIVLTLILVAVYQHLRKKAMRH